MTDPKTTLDGTIVREAECHCFGCGHGALGLLRHDPQRDLRQRGFVRINRRWHCPRCAKERGK